MNRQISPRSVFFACCILCFSVGALLAAPADVSTLPKSDLEISGQISLASGGEARFSVLEGAMVTVSDSSGSYGLIPEVLSQEEGRVRFDVYALDEGEARKIGEVESGGRVKAFTGEIGLDVEVLAVKSRGLSPAELTAIQEAALQAKPAASPAASTAERVHGLVRFTSGLAVTFSLRCGETLVMEDPTAGKSYRLTAKKVTTEKEEASFEMVLLNDANLKANSFSAISGGDPVMTNLPGAPTVELLALGERSDQAYTRVISDRIVRGYLTQGTDRLVDFAVLEGQSFRWSVKNEGKTFALAPSLREGGQIRLQVFEIYEAQPGLEAIRWIGQVDTTPGEAVHAPGLGLDVTIEKVEVPLKTAEKPIIGKAAPGRCCIECESNQACGCAASLPCGSCCMSPCCGSEP